jgi:hypothetical protein
MERGRLWNGQVRSGEKREWINGGLTYNVAFGLWDEYVRSGEKREWINGGLTYYVGFLCSCHLRSRGQVICPAWGKVVWSVGIDYGMNELDKWRSEKRMQLTGEGLETQLYFSWA